MKKIFFLCLLIIGCGFIAGFLGAKREKPQERVFLIEARQYSYNPEIIRVNRNDKVIIKLTSKDVTHGFYLEGYDIDAKVRAQYPYFWLRHPSKVEEYEQVNEITFVANKTGKFRYRCSITCGSFHPFMQGELIVKPNFAYPASMGLSLIAGLFSLIYLGTSLKKEKEIDEKGVDLFEKIPWLRKFVKMRSFQFWVILPNFILFYLFIIAGLFGTPVGNHNIMIVFIWILWWFVLISFMVPFFSRIWCTVCPLPIVGDWLQRLSFLKVRFSKTDRGFIKHKFFGLNKTWPKRFQNIWLQNIGFLILACFSGFLVTRPIVSVAVLGGMILLATILGFIYKYRAFCMYLCPVSGFLGLYAMTSKLALRAKDYGICKIHAGKECFLGNEKGYPCPWFQAICTMDRNNYCGLCMECVKSCSKDNIGLYWRSFCGDKRLKGYDEVWKSFIMLGLALVYSINFLGPWGTFKDWANFTESGKWVGFLLLCLGMVLLCLVILPGIYYLFIRLVKFFSQPKGTSIKTLFISYAYSLVPLGLFAWIAFSVSLIMVNGSYIISVVSDPLGKGWNLLGTANFAWSPLFPELVPYIQIPILLAGLFYSLKSSYEIGSSIFPEKRQLIRSLIPLTIFLVSITLVFLRIFVG